MLTDQQTAQDQINRVLMATFCRTLNNTRLPPVVVMRMIASALGKAYAGVAATHQAGRCSCGWQPSPVTDVELMRSALACAVVNQEDLWAMAPVGRA
ncbi:hypothetical protein HNR60_001880 [Rhodopseudomonas rhenobacensis]|uniref:Uncharacterized protein n=1 Tax=Rhodopseudomonas rhenobacensis TaxID=87461 RepID=A0A7W7Z3F3_9BRAD|nr:hypothetical protein [Rhodopseudomonas rhenobacensis]